MKTYAKTVVGVLLAVSTWGVTAFSDGKATAAEWFGGLGAVATGLGVYYTKNDAYPPTEEPEDTDV